MFLAEDHSTVVNQKVPQVLYWAAVMSTPGDIKISLYDHLTIM